MGFLDRAKQLVRVLDLDEVRVRRPKSIVFLCGGRSLEAAAIPSSVREALLRSLPSRDRLAASEIILAERATEALPQSSFDNLLDLEECIAAVVDAVVLIVESAGSICELGAFAKTDEIRQKLIIIVRNDHVNARSFITLGALRYIEHHAEGVPVHPFDWQDTKHGVSVPDYVTDGIRQEVAVVVDAIPEKQKFDRTKTGHKIYLTLAFCHLLRGAKFGELKECLHEAIGADKVSDTDIHKYLDTLQICGLIERVANGAKRVHYISLVERLPLDVSFLDGTPDEDRNILRWVNAIIADIRDEDPIRLQLFQEHNHAA